MLSSPPTDITALLVEWGDGDASALDRLLPLVERELHRLAHSYMRREDPDHTLQTTALINETYECEQAQEWRRQARQLQQALVMSDDELWEDA